MLLCMGFVLVFEVSGVCSLLQRRGLLVTVASHSCAQAQGSWASEVAALRLPSAGSSACGGGLVAPWQVSLPKPNEEPMSLHSVGGFLPTEPPKKSYLLLFSCIKFL